MTRHSDAGLLDGILQGKCIHDRRQHPHVITGHPVHTPLRQAGTAQQVAAADHDTDLRPAFADRVDLLRQPLNDARINTMRTLPHECLAAQLQQYSMITHHQSLLITIT